MLSFSPALARRPTLRYASTQHTSPGTRLQGPTLSDVYRSGQASTPAKAASQKLPLSGEPTERNGLLELDPASPSFKTNLEAKYAPQTRDVWAGIVKLVTKRLVERLVERGVPQGQLRGIVLMVLPKILPQIAARLESRNTDTTPSAIAGYEPRRLASTELWSDAGPTAQDIRQGKLGDCYFLAALGAVVTEDPEIIKRGIEPHRDALGNIVVGQWDVTLHVLDNGEAVQKTVTVDDKLLRDVYDNERYAQKTDNDGDGAWEQWVAIYEKAYAQLRSDGAGIDAGYARLDEGGWGGEAYFALTGRQMVARDKKDPARTDPRLMDEESLLAILERTNPVNGQAVLLGTRAVDSKNPTDRVNIADGLPATHLYQVLGTYEDEWSGETMVTLRNPWGYYEPNDDRAIMDASGHLVADIDRNDGIFSVPLSQIRRDFSRVAYTRNSTSRGIRGSSALGA